MCPSSPLAVRLRPILPADLPTLFQFQIDPAGNHLAATHPYDLPTYNARWAQILLDPTVVPRAIIDGDTVLGSICAFKQEDTDSIGYWIAREHWGKGCATRAIALLLDEVPTRPLFARVAAHNVASLRALQRNGFVITARRHAPATPRYLACERLTLTLA